MAYVPLGLSSTTLDTNLRLLSSLRLLRHLPEKGRDNRKCPLRDSAAALPYSVKYEQSISDLSEKEIKKKKKFANNLTRNWQQKVA